MKDFFKDIFLFHYKTNQQLLEAMEHSVAEKTEEMLDIFSHSINAHQIWNARILERKGLGVFQRHEIHHCQAWNKQNYFDSVDIIESRDLDETIFYENSRADSYSNTIGEILFHISNHFSHHRGQLAQIMRKAGMAPPITDYIYYKRGQG
jgi:uncharacterized damage-inducible protein DinB